MKIVNYFFIAFATLAMAVSCAVDEAPKTIDQNNVKQSVTIKIANVKAPDALTRATQTGYTDAGVNVTTVSALRAIFADGDDILQVVELATPVAATADDDTFWWERAAEEGLYKFHMLPAGVDKVAITNLPATADVTLSSVKTAAEGALPANWQGAQNVPVWGESLAANWTEVGTDEHPVGVDGVAYKYYNAGTVTVASLLARIEIGGVACTDLATGRFSALTFGTIGITYGTTEAAWLDGAAWTKDTYAADTVFGYNVAPGTVPNIVLQVTGGTTNPTGLVVPWPLYVRTTELRSLDLEIGTGTDGKIESFTAGNIYKITYAFTGGDVKPWSEDSQYICVDVTVSIQEWNIVDDVTPVFN